MWYVSWLASAGINSKKPVPVPPQHAYDTAMCRARVKEDFLRSVLTTRFDYCKQNRTENVHTGPGLEARVASEKACSFPCFHIRSTKKKKQKKRRYRAWGTTWKVAAYTRTEPTRGCTARTDPLFQEFRVRPARKRKFCHPWTLRYTRSVGVAV